MGIEHLNALSIPDLSPACLTVGLLKVLL